jgi:hypothetical protein
MSYGSSRIETAPPPSRGVLSVRLACAALVLGACSDAGLSSAPSVDAASPAQSQTDAAPAPDTLPSGVGVPQPISDYGRLGGALSGYAWVAGGTGTTWISPNPCNDQACFTNTDGILCAQGSIAALNCASASSCDWDANWGAMIGWNPTPVQQEPWGSAASAGIAVTYKGSPGEYRLTAHIVGDPDSKVYCIENYVSDSVGVPADFLSECWANAGDVLPDFAVVDGFGLQLISAHTPIDFDICISAIRLF